MADDDDRLEQERAEKREFLQREIVNGGFNPTDFVAFCDSQRGADIDLWTLPELQACVLAFKHSQFPPEEHTAEERKSPEIDSIEDCETPGKPVAVSIEGDYSISAKTAIPSELSLCPAVQVTLPKSDVISGGFLSSSYILFTVKTSPLDWTVMRRYADFLAVRKVLLAHFPGYFVCAI